MSTTNPTWTSAVRDRRTSLRQDIIAVIDVDVQSFEKTGTKWSDILRLLWNVYTPGLFINIIFSTYYFMSEMVKYFLLSFSS